ncbi:DUF6680 family protein [Paraburkholderia sp. UCT2]|uniref:DUF6680 family protein n=1 Tax=Paraburkholderia sp. UCT2 TaxID=2615208 RepID=UPI001655AE77|nr:DUF6680 family protein [Paraburkholderia sp. UCT2]MBC8730026.1 hypothetical protein [Paraburkholderia sp. UCT2]
MNWSDLAIVFATLMGPILAVQAQKWIERGRERGARKHQILLSLMATRQARLSPEHVRSLNMIDLAFYGSETRGRRSRTKAEQAVIDAWREYLDNLNIPDPAEDAARAAFYASRDELFINLLASMAKERRLDFDRVQLKRGAYTPKAHGDIEGLQAIVLRGAAGVLSGKEPIKIAPFTVNAPAEGAAEPRPQAQG